MDALFSAVYESDVDAVYALIFEDVDVNGRNEAGNSAIHAAAFTGDAKVIDILAKAGAYVDARGRNGNAPLHFAAYRNKRVAVEKLLQLGADPLVRNNSGKSPRDVCVSSQHKHIADILEKCVIERCAFLAPHVSPKGEEQAESEASAEEDSRIELLHPPPVFPRLAANMPAVPRVAPTLSKLTLGAARRPLLQRNLLSSRSSSGHQLVASPAKREIGFAATPAENNATEYVDDVVLESTKVDESNTKDEEVIKEDIEESEVDEDDPHAFVARQVLAADENHATDYAEENEKNMFTVTLDGRSVTVGASSDKSWLFEDYEEYEDDDDDDDDEGSSSSDSDQTSDDGDKSKSANFDVDKEEEDEYDVVEVSIVRGSRGLGILLEENPNGPYAVVSALMPGGPAELAGISVADLLVEIEGESAAGVLGKVVSRLSAVSAESPSKLSFLRRKK